MNVYLLVGVPCKYLRVDCFSYHTYCTTLCIDVLACFESFNSEQRYKSDGIKLYSKVSIA